MHLNCYLYQLKLATGSTAATDGSATTLKKKTFSSFIEKYTGQERNLIKIIPHTLMNQPKCNNKEHELNEN